MRDPKLYENFTQQGVRSFTENREIQARNNLTEMATRTCLFITLCILIAPFAWGQDMRVLPCVDLFPFYHGVASGDPLSDRVIIWTRVTPDEVIEDLEVEWRVALDSGMTELVATGSTFALLDRDMTVKVDVTGLQPNTFYYYDFKALDHYSIRGRTKTLPSGPIDRHRMAVAACSNYEHGYFNGYKYLAERNDIDLVLHLGDYIYEYAVGGYSANIPGRTNQPEHETVTLEDYRIRHSHYRLDADLRAAHQQFPFIAVWDDHESANDSWFGGAENHSPDQGNWFDRKAASKQAFYEWLPIRGDESDPLFRSFDIGNLVRLMMLDTRLHGRDEQVGLTSSQVSNPDRTILGQDQKDWLEWEFITSAATWNVLGQQVMMAPLRAFGAILNTDQWDGYEADREWLYNRIQQSSMGKTIVLSGDIHTSWANELPLPWYNANQQIGSAGVEFICTSITSPGLAFLPGSAAQLFNPHARYVNLADRGFLVVEYTPQYTHGDWVYVNTINAPDGGSYVGASYRTNIGSPFVFNAGAPLPNADYLDPLAPECPWVEPADEEEEEEDDEEEEEEEEEEEDDEEEEEEEDDDEEEDDEEEEDPTSISEQERNFMVTGVYPNPFNSAVQVQFGLVNSARLTVQLFDLNGRMIYHQELGQFQQGLNYLELRLPELASGTYLLRLDAEGRSVTRRVMKL